MSVHVFGIRHHGPGSARSLRAALETLRPDLVAIEGPPDADEALKIASQEDLVPPVALLVYPPEVPGRAVFFPFASFSPEWNALRWALESSVPVRFIDLPQSHQLALEDAAVAAARIDASADESEPPSADARESDEKPECASDGESAPDDALAVWRSDPIRLLAEAAGFRDHERWWENEIERRENAVNLFEAILEVMRAARESIEEKPDRASERNLLREAWMRRSLRAARKEGFQRIACVCGAWHAPVLDELALDGKRPGTAVGEDRARLRGLPRRKTEATWIPWTHSRLSLSSGYGAGVEAPGWYEHLFRTTRDVASSWLARSARLLREEDLDASSASVIEAVRLADTLSALRDLRAPGLLELNDATQAILCHGDSLQLDLVRRGLEIGERLGTVPENTPTVPLARDLAREQKRLRLAPSTSSRTLDLDLRTDGGRERSRLLHRLRLLGVDWGRRQAERSRSSTFHEIWRLEWTPELAVSLIEASVHGATVEIAAVHRCIEEAVASTSLDSLTELLDGSVLAGLDAALEPLLARVQEISAVATDVAHLLRALPALARISRYGDVRGTRIDAVEPILVGLLERALIGLPLACLSLDEDASAARVDDLATTAAALALLERDDLLSRWHETIEGLASGGAHALLRGWCTRHLLDARRLDPEELHRRARLELSPARAPADCAAWARGLLRGSALALLQLEDLWRVFDRWLRQLDGAVFLEMLPLLRRAFADFQPAERRQMSATVARFTTDSSGTSTPPGATLGDAGDANASSPDRPDEARARRVLPVLARILGKKEIDP